MGLYTEERKLSVKRSKEICSCGSCFARNYDSDRAFGQRVDVIYEVKIGTMVNCLCKDCLKELRKGIDQILL